MNPIKISLSKEQWLSSGGGPTIYQLISSRNKVQEIIFSDYLDKNLQEVEKWRNNSKVSFNWDSYFKLVLKLENKKVNAGNLINMKNELKNKIIELERCNGYDKKPLSNYHKKFDILSTCFCPEIVNNEKDYVNFLRNITTLLKLNGHLIMLAVKNAKFYKVGEINFPAYKIDETHVKRILEKIGYSNIKIKTMEINNLRGYGGIMGVTAIKISEAPA